jgi:hypothetical protein
VDEGLPWLVYELFAIMALIGFAQITSIISDPVLRESLPEGRSKSTKALSKPLIDNEGEGEEEPGMTSKDEENAYCKAMRFDVFSISPDTQCPNLTLLAKGIRHKVYLMIEVKIYAVSIFVDESRKDKIADILLSNSNQYDLDEICGDQVFLVIVLKFYRAVGTHAIGN